MTIQFVAFIAAGYWIGHLMAGWFSFDEGSGELAGMLFFLITGLIKMIRDILQENR